jgi:hypothetical protein
MKDSTYFLLVCNMYIAASMESRELIILIALVNGVLAFLKTKKEKEGGE